MLGDLPPVSEFPPEPSLAPSGHREAAMAWAEPFSGLTVASHLG